MDLDMTLLGQMLSFAILIWFTVKFIWPPLMAAIEERQQKIAEGLAAADRSQKDLAQAQDKVNEELQGRARQGQRDHRRRPHAARQPDHRPGQERRDRRSQPPEGAGRSRDRRRRQPRQEDLRKQVSALAVTGAEKLLQREIDANAHKALLDDLAAQL